jgi:hypothetical protein
MKENCKPKLPDLIALLPGGSDDTETFSSKNNLHETVELNQASARVTERLPIGISILCQQLGALDDGPVDNNRMRTPAKSLSHYTRF